MSNLEHSFRKTFLGTKADQSASGSAKKVQGGFLATAGVHTSELYNTASPYALGPGVFGLFDAASGNSVVEATVNTGGASLGKPLVLAAASLFPKDKIGPFHGGYQESNKSKMINPRYVTKFMKIEGADAEQPIYHLGRTNFTKVNPATLLKADGTVAYTLNTVATLAPSSGTATYTSVPLSGGSGTVGVADITVTDGIITKFNLKSWTDAFKKNDVITVPTATSGSNVVVGNVSGTISIKLDLLDNKDFYCGRTYNLRIDVKGSPAYRLLNHAAYRNLAFFTGGCTVPALIDSTLVFIGWAKMIVEDVFLKDFVRPIVYDEKGKPWFATAAEATAAGKLATDIWDNYVSTGHIANGLGGIRLVGAYVDTKFGNSSFQKTDFYNKETVVVLASLYDVDGDPQFEGLDFKTEFAGFGGTGYGETILRDLILDETYLQNYFHSDQRIREITQGDQYLANVSRVDSNGNYVMYDVYLLQHSVPRPNYAQGELGQDQYLLQIAIPKSTAATDFENTVKTWLKESGSQVTLDTINHTALSAVAL